MVIAFVVIIIQPLDPGIVAIKNEHLEMGKHEPHHESMHFKDLEEHTKLSSGMESRKKEARGTKKCLLCPAFKENTLRSKTRREAGEVILFTVVHI